MVFALHFISSTKLTGPLPSLVEPLSEPLAVDRLWIDKQEEESVEELLFLEVIGIPGGKMSKWSVVVEPLAWGTSTDCQLPLNPPNNDFIFFNLYLSTVEKETVFDASDPRVFHPKDMCDPELWCWVSKTDSDDKIITV